MSKLRNSLLMFITSGLLAIVFGIAVLVLPIWYLAKDIEVQAQTPTVINVNTTAISAATTYTLTNWTGGRENYTVADVFMFVDQTDINTLTLNLQVSPDNETYVDHVLAPALMTNNVADSNVYTSSVIHGRHARIQATVGNTNTVTPTIIVVLR